MRSAFRLIKNHCVLQNIHCLVSITCAKGKHVKRKLAAIFSRQKSLLVSFPANIPGLEESKELNNTAEIMSKGLAGSHVCHAMLGSPHWFPKKTLSYDLMPALWWHRLCHMLKASHKWRSAVQWHRASTVRHQSSQRHAEDPRPVTWPIPPRSMAKIMTWRHAAQYNLEIPLCETQIHTPFVLSSVRTRATTSYKWSQNADHLIWKWTKSLLLINLMLSNGTYT